MQWTHVNKRRCRVLLLLLLLLILPPLLSCAVLRGEKILLESSLDLFLLRWGLVGTMTKLGRRVDPLEVNLLKSLPRAVSPHRFTERHDPLLNTRDGALNHDEVVVD